MRFHHLVFDARLLVDAFVSGDGSGPLQILMARIARGDCTGWLPAQTLSGLQAGLVSHLEASGRSPSEAMEASREHITSLLVRLQLLTLPGEESRALIGQATNLTEAQVALAALALGGDACIVTNNPHFDTLGKVPALAPKEVLSAADGELHTPFIDLAAQERRILPRLEARLRGVLRHSQFIMGPEVLELEARLSDYVGVRHAITCSSGTDALLMPLMAYGIGPGDAVFTTPFTFVATAEAISLAGATPVFVDIDPITYNIDPASLDRAVQALLARDASVHPLPGIAIERQLVPRAVIPVDLFGLPADYDALWSVSRKHGLRIIEDAAQSFGATYKGRRAGGLGDVGATSFFPAKPLGCYGDGGAVFTDDDELAERMISIRVHGQGTDKYENVRIGLNARFDTIQAAVLLAKLDIFDKELDLRQLVAARYTEFLTDDSTTPKTRLVTPSVPEGSVSAWAQYSVLSEQRGRICTTLAKHGIPTAIYYPKPLHLQRAYDFLGYHEGDFPVSEFIAGRVFSLPMHPYIGEPESRRLARAITSSLV